MSDPIKIQLKTPITFGRDEIKELSFREPVAGDFFGLPIDKQTVGDVMALASPLCGKPPAALAKLSLADMKEVLEVVGGFMTAGLGMPTTP